MSLRVWLPLNGTLDNQGLDDVVVTNNGATVDNNGKIGKCYSFDGNSSGININGNIISTLAQGDFSICFWIYNDDQGNRSIYIATVPSSGYAFAIQKTTGEGLRVYWQSSPDYYPTNFTVPVQEWCHITVVIKNNNCYCYKNGILVTSREDGSFTPQKLTNTWLYGMLGRDLRTGATVFKGKMNDFRWYDHALSPLEVKQISQGLILHYPLNRNGWGQENLFALSDFNDISTLGSPLANASRPLAIYNGNISLHTFSNGIDTISLNSGGNIGICFVRLATDINLDTSSYYTISCWSKCSKINAHLDIGLSYYNNSDTGVWRGGTGSQNYKAINTWQYFTRTFKPDTDTKAICYCFTVVGTSGSTDTFSIKQCKLEEGSIATPWCPNSSDAFATTIGLNNNIQYDTSGYGNNGTRTGTFSWISDTPKYQISTYFADGSTSYITASVFMPTDKITTNVWFKGDGSTSGANSYHIPFCLGSGTAEFSVDNAKLYRQGYYINGTRYCDTISGAVVNDGQWHMMTATYDGTTLCRYLDGQLINSKSISGTLDGGIRTLLIGKYYQGGYNNKKVKQSDVRIYATALSADDVKSLYNNSAYIDNQGNIYGAMYEEV